MAIAAYSLSYWTIASISARSRSQIEAWSMQIQLAFPGVAQNRYIDGGPFSSEDLVSPAVLKTVVEELRLPIGVEELRNSISVFSPDSLAKSISSRFREMAEAADTAAQVAEIEREFMLAWQRSTRSNVELAWVSGPTELPVAQVLEAIPEAWRRYARSESGVFSSMEATISPALMSSLQFVGVDRLFAYESLRNVLKAVDADIQSLTGHPNAATMRTASGASLADLDSKVNRMLAIDLEQAFIPILQTGAVADRSATIMVLDDRIQELSRRIRLENSLGDQVDRGIRDYVGGASHAVSRGTPQDEPAIPALGSEFLDRLVLLSVDAAEAEFRQELATRSIEHRLKAAELDSELSRIRRLREAIAASNRSLPDDLTGGGPAATSMDALDAVEVDVTQLVSALHELRIRLEGGLLGEYSGSADFEIVSPPRQLSTWTWRSGPPMRSFLIGLVSTGSVAILLMGLAYALAAYSRRVRSIAPAA